MRWRARPWRSSKLGSTDPSRCLGRLPHSNLRCSGRSSWWSAPWAAWRGSLTGSWCSERRLHPGKPSLEGPWSSPANWNDHLLQVRQSNSLVGHFPSPPTLSESSWAPWLSLSLTLVLQEHQTTNCNKSWASLSWRCKQWRARQWEQRTNSKVRKHDLPITLTKK